jgi:uncharacterized protein (DUF885 family)
VQIDFYSGPLEFSPYVMNQFGLQYTREQAKGFMREFLPGPEDRIDSTIDRLLAMPAQSLSYHVGADRFFHLRDYAMAALGDDFDIAEFHDQALSAGALPLEILEERIRAWVAHGK